MFLEQLLNLAHTFRDGYQLEIPFEDQAYQILAESNIEQYTSLSELSTFAKTPEAKRMKYYKGNEFGEMPVTVYRDKNFFLDVYTWNNHDTSLHNHSFIGAFKLLSGASLDTQYTFEGGFWDNYQQVERGELREKKTTMMKVGDCERIQLRNQFIHQVWHLHQPTITLCLRTYPLVSIEDVYHRGIRFTYCHKKVARVLELLTRERDLDTIQDPSLLRGVFQSTMYDQKRQHFAKRAKFLLTKKFGIALWQESRKSLLRSRLKHVISQATT